MSDISLIGLSLPVAAFYISIAWVSISFNNPVLLWLWIFPTLLHMANFGKSNKVSKELNKEE